MKLSILKTKLLANFHVRKFASFGIGSIVAILISYLTTFILNKELERQSMGEYSYIFNILNLSFQVVSLTMYSSYLRFMVGYDFFKVVRFIKLYLYASTVLFFFAIYFVYDDWRLLPFVLVILFNERLYFFRSKLDIGKYNFLNVLQKVIYLLALMFFIYYLKYSLAGNDVILYLGISYAIAYLVSLLVGQKEQNTQNNSQPVAMKTIYVFSLVTMFTTVLNWVLSVSDQIVIEWFYGAEALAPYAVSFRVVSFIGLFTSIFISYYPTLYFREFESGKFANAMLFRRLFIGLLIFVTIVLFIFSDLAYKALGAADYLDELDYFYWLLFGELLRVIASIYMTYRTFRLQQGYIFASLSLVALLNVVLNIIFIPQYGPIAAAVSTFLSFVVYFFLSMVFSFLPEKRYIATVEGTA